MESHHGESHDCRAHGWRHGGRRRCCTICGRTWTVYPRRPGRKKLRAEKMLPRHLLIGKLPARLFIARRRCSPTAFYEHSRRAFARLAKRPYWPQLPETDDLILMVDGLWFAVRGVESVLYSLALRPVHSDNAYLLDPIVLDGKEYEKTWRDAIGTAIRPDALPRIRALVADGFKGARAIASDHGWIYQRCHWHLLSTLGTFGVRRCKRMRGRVARDVVLRLVHELLYEQDEQLVPQLCADLRELACDECLGNRRIRYVVTNFLRDVDHFRAYLRHPELRLPTTTGAMESLHALVRGAISRVNSPQSILNRARCLVRLHPPVRCNGHKNPQD